MLFIRLPHIDTNSLVIFNMQIPIVWMISAPFEVFCMQITFMRYHPSIICQWQRKFVFDVVLLAFLILVDVHTF